MLNPPPNPREGRNADVPLSLTSRVAQFAVNCLFNSLGSMPIKYFNFSEKDFHAELYHQCRQRFSQRIINLQFPNEPAVPHPIVLTSESGKSVSAAYDNFGIDICHSIPDLLFHNPEGLESQWCTVELKRRNPLTDIASISRDLDKLNIYVSDPLHFRHSIFILNNFPRDTVTVGHNFCPGPLFTTHELLNLLKNQIPDDERDCREYLEIWVISQAPAAVNAQDPVFVLERTFHNSAIVQEPWQTQIYTRRANRLSLSR